MRRRYLKPPPSQGMGGDPFIKPKVQTKLAVGKSDDKYEIEADKMADQVVNKTKNGDAVQKMEGEEEVQQKPLVAGVTPLVQKMEASEEEAPVQKMEEEEPVQAKEEEEPVQKAEEEEAIQTMEEEEPVQAMEEEEAVQKKEEEEEAVQTMEEEEPVQAMEEEEAVQKTEEEEEVQTKSDGKNTKQPSIENRLKHSSGGTKLDAKVRTEMEKKFGTDFSHIKIHNDSAAAQMCQELGAQAFTHGNDVYFNEGKYGPNSIEGKRLLAHELTHTIQQSGMIPENLQFVIGDGNDLQAARFSGNTILEACLDNKQILQKGSTGSAVRLIQQALEDAGFPLPIFHADSIFGDETLTALQDFQGASSLSVKGIVESSTMSALDALYAGGAPSFKPEVPITPATIISETIKAAPDGSSNTRTTVGVGERVRFSANTAGTWIASNGHFIGRNHGSNIVWEAPAVATSPVITILTPRGASTTRITVITPNALTMTVNHYHDIPAGTAGACMVANITVNPLNVNFGRTQLQEETGIKINEFGYFTQFEVNHKPNKRFAQVNDINTGMKDHVALENGNLPAPFSFGTLDWKIPYRYKIDGESDEQGRFFTNTTQSFNMYRDGTLIINKAGAWVKRLLNNTVTN